MAHVLHKMWISERVDIGDENWETQMYFGSMPTFQFNNLRNSRNIKRTATRSQQILFSRWVMLPFFAQINSYKDYQLKQPD